MADALITVSNNLNQIPVIVASRALPRLKGNCVAYQASDPSYADEVSNFGSTVQVPIPPTYVTNLMADGGAITLQNPNMGTASIVLNRHRELSFSITDLNAAVAKPDLQGTNLGQAIANYAEAVDSDFLGVYSQFTGISKGAYATAITVGVIGGADTELFNQKVPRGMRRSLILTGQGYEDLRVIQGFVNNDQRGKGDSASDVLEGQIRGFDVFRSQQVSVTNSGSDKHGLAFSPAALLTAVRPLGNKSGALPGVLQVELAEDGVAIRLTGSYVHSILGGMWTIDTLYGFVSGRTAHGLELKH